MGSINMNEMAASIYNTVMQLQNAATQLVGLDVLWCRALPYENSEDVIVLEYTLSNVECPTPLKVVTDKAEYQMGLYTFGPLGIDFDTDMQISIDISTWQAVYGANTMPQKGDIVIFQTYNRAYEVSSSQVVYTLASLPTSYKCTLAKYLRQASRRESDDFRDSMDEMTVSQDRLFGDAISKEVADAVAEVETSYNQTTMVDPIKTTFDINSVITDDIKLYRGHIISHAYYDFSIADSDILYNIQAVYDTQSDDSHWIYSSWFKINSDVAGPTVFKFKELYLKEKTYWYFTYITAMKLQEGDKVTLQRGKLLTISGEIDSLICDNGYVLKIATADVLRASKKLTNWYAKTGVWTIQKESTYNLFTGYNTLGNVQLSFNITLNNICIQNGAINKNISVLDIADTWHYIAVDMTSENIRLLLIANTYNEKTKTYKEKIVVDETFAGNNKSFEISNFGINNKGANIYMTNIRLYENKYAMGDTYKLDMYNAVTKNASKLILVDTPNSANNMQFVSPIK